MRRTTGRSGGDARSRLRRGATGGLVALVAWAGASFAEGEPRAELSFERRGAAVGSLRRAELVESCGLRRVSVDDPYYEARKEFLACPLEGVLEAGFGTPAEDLAHEQFLLEARDGFTRPAPGTQLFEGGAFVALGEAEGGVGSWQPIDRRQVDPGPFYLVWTGADQADPHRHPWPYQLARVRIASLDELYPHMRPQGLVAEDPAWTGLRVFQSQCIACHAINGEGGKVGPDLNVPQSIVEYRPEAQIRAYIRNPETFRYTTMPAHLDLSESELDALISYFEAMKSRKHDPAPAAGAAP